MDFSIQEHQYSCTLLFGDTDDWVFYGITLQNSTNGFVRTLEHVQLAVGVRRIKDELPPQ